VPRGRQSNASTTYRYKKQWRGTQRQKVLDAFGRRCAYCGHPGDDGNGKGLTQAHVVAHRQGGGDGYDDVVLLCRRCHGRLDGGRRYS
jgi:5-methylcytosine-specific restriction endonuclease McrA